MKTANTSQNCSIPVEKPKRAPKFTQDELKALVDAVLPNYKLLFGDFSNDITSEKKQAMWAVVATTVSAVSKTERTAEKVNLKFTHWKSETRKKAARLFKAREKTGGGNDDLDSTQLEEIFLTMYGLTESEKRLIHLIGYQTVVGIDGGLDSFEEKNPISNGPPSSSNALVPVALSSQNLGIPVQKTTLGSTEMNSGNRKPSSTDKVNSKKLKEESAAEKILKEQSQLTTCVKEIGNALTELVEISKQRLQIEKQRWEMERKSKPEYMDLS